MRESLTRSAGTIRLGSLVLLSLLMLGVAFADEADPPGRVARLSYLQGAVSVEPAGQQDWVGAELNRPLTTSDKLWSDAPGSRAELDMGGAVIRLGSNTGFSFLNLDDNVAQMQVTAGTAIVHVREFLEGQTYEIDTPNVALVLDQAGSYRIDVSEAGDATVVKVDNGQAEANDGAQSIPLGNQQMMTFPGTEPPSAVTSTLGAPDGFDDWSYERDGEFEQASARQYVADDVVGSEDLDDNGQWQVTPDYGYVWIPTAVAVGWVPYSYGHWAWISPWGWTWIDSAPWGFAPFHYGRWAHWNNSWCWVPGPRRFRPTYSPAMVAWVGGGAGAAGVGWFPLAPTEIYVPGYPVSYRYFHTINVGNTTIVDRAPITNVYQNRVTNIHYANSSVPGAVTTVPQNVFASAQPVNAHRVSLPPSQLAHLDAVARPPLVAPVGQSVLGGRAARRPPQALLNRLVVARTTPPSGSGVRVRLVRSATRANPVVQARPAAQQARSGSAAGSLQPRPGVAVGSPLQTRPAVSLPPSAPPEVDMRSLAEREHALEQRTLPPSQPLRYERERAEGESQAYQAEPSEQESSQSDRVAPGRVFRDDRPPSAYQSEEPRAEESRAPVNSYSRPAAETYSRPVERPPVENPVPVEHHSVEEHRSAPVPATQMPVPQPAPAPSVTTSPPQHAPSTGHREEHEPPRARPRVDSPPPH